MSAPLRALTATAFVAILIGLGVTDYVFTHNKFVLPQGSGAPVIADAEDSSSSSADAQKVEQGPEVSSVLSAKGFSTSGTREESVLREVIPADREVQSQVLLLNGDRIAFLAWTQSGDVKTYFSALKSALQASFSPQVHDLVDQTDTPEGRPTRNVLAFSDPTIHEEKMIFVRVQQRLFEFHVAPGKDTEVNALIDALTE